jgi:DNA-binding PadR family transcriptional regulator
VESVRGRRRRVHRLTARGRAALERQRAEWRSYAQPVEAVVA